MTRELAGCHIVRRLKTDSDADYLLLLADEKGQTKIAAWTTGKAHDFTLNFNAQEGAVTLTTGDGSASQPKVQDGRLTIELQPLPSYLTPGKLEIKE
jgi:hypothetical protein